MLLLTCCSASALCTSGKEGQGAHEQPAGLGAGRHRQGYTCCASDNRSHQSCTFPFQTLTPHGYALPRR